MSNKNKDDLVYFCTNGREFAREWERDKYVKVLAAMKTLIDETNTMGSEPLVAMAMVDGLTSEHRTLQQNFFRSFICMLHKWTKGDVAKMTDLRNEDSWRFANKIVAMDPYFSNV